MREIKFRVFDNQDKRIIVHEQDFIPLKITNIGVLRLDHSSKENKWILLPIERFEIMQYTGFKDINGVEVFEGDIVEILYNGLGNKIVEFENGKYNISDYNVKHCKVIGNIHQNKELLK